MSYWRQRCGKKGLRATDCVSDDTSASVNREKGAWIREYIGTENGGGGGIRTLVTGSTGETVFETAAFNHSATPPQWGFEPQIPFWGIHDFQSCSFGQLGHLSA